MNTIKSKQDYEEILNGNSEPHIVEQDIAQFKKEIKKLQRLINLAKERLHKQAVKNEVQK